MRPRTASLTGTEMAKRVQEIVLLVLRSRLNTRAVGSVEKSRKDTVPEITFLDKVPKIRAVSSYPIM